MQGVDCEGNGQTVEESKLDIEIMGYRVPLSPTIKRHMDSRRRALPQGSLTHMCGR